MPNKIETEAQLLRLLGNSPLQVDIELLQMATHTSKNTSQEHLTYFYKVFEDIRHEYFDGMIITGAPVEKLEYEQVDYWDELCEIMDWSVRHVYSTMHICWGAQAAIYHHFGVPKYELDEKLSGVYVHRVMNIFHPLMIKYFCRIPDIQVCTVRIYVNIRSLKFLHPPILPAQPSSQTKTADNSLYLVMRNTTGILLQTNISVTATRA